ncbi:MAG: PelD GGDEF domain-containing protein [Methylococcales bacterium]
MFQRVPFRLSKSATKTSTAVTETIVLTVLGIILGFWFTPGTAFFAVPGFSWLIIGPFLSGLRYGFVYSLNSALFLIAFMWSVSEYLALWSTVSFSSTALSILFIATVAGEFHNYWQRQINKLQVASDYLDRRLAEVSNAFNLIKISHDRLVQRTASRSTLRDSILAVRTHIMKAKLTDSDIVSLSGLILRIFADYGSIQQAGLYTLDEDGKFNSSAIAFFGGHFELNVDDVLLKKTLSELKTTSLKPELATKEEYSHLLLLAIPLVDVYGELRALILVNKMPFRAFRQDNIRLAAILGGHIADLISMKSSSDYTGSIDLQYFMLQLKRCMNDVKAFDLPGSIVCLQIDNKKHGSGINALVIGRQRGLDSVWALKNKQGKHCVFLLLPLTDSAGIEGYKVRLQLMIKENYGYKSLEDAGVTLIPRGLADSEFSKDLMLELFHEVEIDEDLWNENNSQP